MNAVAAGGLVDPDARDTARMVLRRHGKTFFLASRLLGSRHAERAATLYAFCRHVDNLADEAVDPQAARLALAAVARAMYTVEAPDPWTAAMLKLQSSSGMPMAPALDLVEGVSSDLDPVRIADEAALVRYAYQVAGTVGLMMCAVLDVRDPRAHPFAIDLGIAMQLTNIARDVGEDARMGRRYLPSGWIGEVEPSSIASPDAVLQRRLQAGTQRLLALAERYYASAERGLGFLPLRARLAILVAARLYRAIGARVAANGHASWDRRAVVSAPRKVLYALRALVDFALLQRLHRRDAAHDASLQVALRPAIGRDG